MKSYLEIRRQHGLTTNQLRALNNEPPQVTAEIIYEAVRTGKQMTEVIQYIKENAGTSKGDIPMILFSVEKDNNQLRRLQQLTEAQTDHIITA